MAEKSAGLLVFRRRAGIVEFLLVHPGGPFWKNKDEGAWSIPKGLIDEDEETLTAASREFEEEVGIAVDGDFAALTPLKQKSGKTVHAWLVEADLDLTAFRSNVFAMEWPRRSGRKIEVAEVDRAAYFPPEVSLKKILPGQAGFIAQALGLIR
ncbi:MAG TPA: NUDIX domain-containing protein [Caulobacteraceae bacterium]|nr:NUDIX domain-containing protein [Caulobacteraceae bacterium]